MRLFRIFLLFALSLQASSLFEKGNTATTFLFRTDFGSMKGADTLPAGLLLIDTSADLPEWHFDLSLLMQGQKDFSDTGVSFNRLSATRYFGDNEVKIGKFVTQVGVLDYLSVSNILNTVRLPFFDDPDPQIRRIPQWMAKVELLPKEDVRLRLFAEPFDRRYHDYTSTYLSLALDRLLPAYLQSQHLNNPMLEEIKKEILLPAYRNAVAPAVKKQVNDYYNPEDLSIDKAMAGFDLTYQGFDTTLGLSWFNKYSEIPYVKIDARLLDMALEREDPARALQEYLEQNDLSLVKGVDGFRYNQVSLYGETSFSRFGLRAEATYRDRFPFVDGYTALSTVGMGIDDNGEHFYNDLEAQVLYSHKDRHTLFAAIWDCRYRPFFLHGVEVTAENYTMLGAVEGEQQFSFLPTVTLTYQSRLSLQLRYLLYPDDHDLNIFSTTLGVRF
ncbi:hypothetical protein [Hydrogenimonas sp. SS33]|uniref:hypothetical protein n=1 Tax=Hydrogenimonas leucolamina TaxID=2954236 RepID=UPI00336BF75E